MKNDHKNHELLTLMNVGQATYQDFILLGIHSIAELATASADELYIRLQEITGQPHDPCVWDVFASAIHEANTGEKQRWWVWSKIRKERAKNGTFCVHK
jgi:nucleotidyltransferase/DNA polymerase involved in DNA repair